MSYTRTYTYTTILYADPYLVCDECGDRAAGYMIGPVPDAELDHANWPCEHKAGITSLCPSWSPVDGCQCVEHLGAVDHPLAPSDRLAAPLSPSPERSNDG